MSCRPYGGHLYCKSFVVNKFNNKITMHKLEKQEGVYYTQNIENLPIEERVFFREGKGMSATSEHYRIATSDEICAWKELQHKFDNTSGD